MLVKQNRRKPPDLTTFYHNLQKTSCITEKIVVLERTFFWDIGKAGFWKASNHAAWNKIIKLFVYLVDGLCKFILSTKPLINLTFVVLFQTLVLERTFFGTNSRFYMKRFFSANFCCTLMIFCMQ